MFHPIAPNFLLSKITAWKNANENNNGLNSLGFSHDSYTLSFKSVYVPVKFALSPLGGSFVNLIPVYNTGTGNLFVGIDVNHNL